MDTHILWKHLHLTLQSKLERDAESKAYKSDGMSIRLLMNEITFCMVIGITYSSHIYFIKIFYPNRGEPLLIEKLYGVQI